jgi:hypothetical protein
MEQLLHSNTRLHDLHKDYLTVGNMFHPHVCQDGHTYMHFVLVNITLIDERF